MTSQAQSKTLIRSLQLKVKEVESELAVLVDSMKSFVNKPISDVAVLSESGELNSEKFRDLSSYLDYVLSTLVEIDAQIHKPYGTALPPNDIVDKMHEKILVELSNELAKRDERSAHLEKQLKLLSQDSCELITQWEEKENKLNTNMNRLMLKVDELSFKLTNQANEQKNNSDSLTLKVCGMESQAEKHESQISSLSHEINGLRKSCELHENRMVSHENKLKVLKSQNLQPKSLASSVSTELLNAKSNQQTEAPLRNNPVKLVRDAKSVNPTTPAVSTILDTAKIQDSQNPLFWLSKEKEELPQQKELVTRSKVISPLSKEKGESFEELYKELVSNAHLHINDGDADRQKKQALYKAYEFVAQESRAPSNSDSVGPPHHNLPSGKMFYSQSIQNLRPRQPQEPQADQQVTVNQEICKNFTRLLADRLKIPEETIIVTDGGGVSTSGPVQASQHQHTPPQQVQQPKPAHALSSHIRPNMSHMMRPVLTQSPPQIRQATPAPLYNPQQGATLQGPGLNQIQQPLRAQMPQVNPTKASPLEGKANSSSDLTPQVLDTKSSSLKKSIKSQASHRSAQSVQSNKVPFLTYANDKPKLLELRFCFEALNKPKGLPDLEIILDEPNIGPQGQRRKTKPEFPEIFFDQPAERWMGKKMQRLPDSTS